MKMDLDMKLCEHAADHLTSSSKEWAGLYTLIEASDRRVRIFQSSQSPDREDLRRDPELKGAIDYMIVEVRKRRGRDSYYTWDETGGIYMYHKDTTLKDFVKWFLETEGYNINEKILEFENYGVY